MPLSNAAYDAVMRRYDEIRERNRAASEERAAEVARACPEYAALEAEFASLSLATAKERIRNPEFDLTEYRKSLAENAARRRKALLDAGYPEDYLEPIYDCPLCRDTGFDGEARCRCFGRIAGELLYGREALLAAVKGASFDSARFDFYSADRTVPNTGKTERETAMEAFDRARRLVTDEAGRPFSLYLSGSTGVGKTFLARCIAHAAMERGRSVLFFGAPDFFDRMADDAFGKNGNAGGMRALVRDCDLLIIDDLGAEIPNAFVGSELFRVVDERLAAGRSTVISSNLKLDDLARNYSERVLSRVVSGYLVIRLFGRDIRIQTALGAGT